MGRAGLAAGTAVVAAVLAVAGGAAWLLLHDTANPVTVEEAVTSFRTDTEPTPGAASPIREGVYVYATRGFERTDALTGVTHRYPARSTITVTATDCGISLLWRVLEGRSTEWVYCLTDEGWELRSQDERHTFFGRTERTTYICDDTPIRPFGRPVGHRWRISCSTDDADETGTGSIVERRRWRLGRGPSFTELHVRKVTSFSGAIRGTARHDLWFDLQSGLPTHVWMVSETTNDSPVGDVHYEEVVRLALVSLTPRR